jgi:WD40 repeat protein
MAMKSGMASVGREVLPPCFQPVSRYATARTWELARLAPTCNNKTYVIEVAQHPVEQQVLVCASTDSQIHVLDLDKGSLIHSYAEHFSRIWQLCFCNIIDDLDLVHVFFSAAEDGSIKIWDSRAAKSVSNIGTHFAIVVQPPKSPSTVSTAMASS